MIFVCSDGDSIFCPALSPPYQSVLHGVAIVKVTRVALVLLFVEVFSPRAVPRRERNTYYARIIRKFRENISLGDFLRN